MSHEKSQTIIMENLGGGGGGGVREVYYGICASREIGSLPCGMKFSREFNFADFVFFEFLGNKFSRIYCGSRMGISLFTVLFIFNWSTCDYNSKRVRRYDSYCSAI